ncbi:S-linalool synthase-like [Impatiens glandulifera]|uniref:S-linalool synthase-like n=1 Tax=Impatiens glandulifera TaxID=253017 RepID=UPI001FB178D9|nr:S-linalool synthase-like [Impatiens glandulifera]
MEPSFSSIETLVKEIKKEMFSSFSIISPSTSAYETAWLAMIPEDPHERKNPAFKGCLDWVLHSQNDEGFWGEEDKDGHPTIDALPATLACILALKLWGIGDDNINRGLKFINESIVIILKEKQRYNHLPYGFVLLFPSMIIHAQKAGLEISFTNDQHMIVEDIFLKRQQILDSKCIVEQNDCSSFLPYLEAILLSYDQVDMGIITKQIGYDGSLYKSPSATAQAFLATGDQRCLKYLQSLVQNFPNGVPPVYPINEDLVKVCVVDQIQRLGLAEYFPEEIQQILSIAYRNYVGINKLHIEKKNDHFLPLRLYNDSLAFRLLRLHGYDVTPGKFCWFLDDEQVIGRIKKDSSQFLSAILNIYRATDLMFSRETDQLGVVRSFSREILEKSMSLAENVNDFVVILPNFLKMVEHELNMPWIARLDHLDHRFWIEESKSHPLWVGKSSFYRLPLLHDEKLLRLAEQNYKFRQAIYRKELEEVGK